MLQKYFSFKRIALFVSTFIFIVYSRCVEGVYISCDFSFEWSAKLFSGYYLSLINENSFCEDSGVFKIRPLVDAFRMYLCMCRYRYFFTKCIGTDTDIFFDTFWLLLLQNILQYIFFYFKWDIEGHFWWKSSKSRFNWTKLVEILPNFDRLHQILVKKYQEKVSVA